MYAVCIIAHSRSGQNLWHIQLVFTRYLEKSLVDLRNITVTSKYMIVQYFVGKLAEYSR